MKSGFIVWIWSFHWQIYDHLLSFPGHWRASGWWGPYFLALVCSCTCLNSRNKCGQVGQPYYQRLYEEILSKEVNNHLKTKLDKIAVEKAKRIFLWHLQVIRGQKRQQEGGLTVIWMLWNHGKLTQIFCCCCQNIKVMEFQQLVDPEHRGSYSTSYLLCSTVCSNWRPYSVIESRLKGKMNVTLLYGVGIHLILLPVCIDLHLY